MKLLPIPENTPPFRRERIEATRAKMASNESRYVKGGVLYWVTNDAVIPPHVFKDAYVECPEVQTAARQAALDVIFADYRQRQPRTPSAEEAFGMRAAFGPGVEVVDVISGRRWTT